MLLKSVFDSFDGQFEDISTYLERYNNLCLAHDIKNKKGLLPSVSFKCTNVSCVEECMHSGRLKRQILLLSEYRIDGTFCQ